MRICAATLILAMAGMLPAGATPAPAQSQRPRLVVPTPLAVLSHQDLSFGTVLPGVTRSVATSSANAALLEVQGPAEAAVRVEFVLPVALTTAGGAFLPLSFGPADGHADPDRDMPFRGTSFDPRSPLIRALGPAGRLYLRLGGTVTPGRPQAGGAYAATIMIIISDVGT